ncbi:cytochrome P450 81Q32-like [Silene latifolia]|uniref:cytochrome P450 81Q32-like n=1 Tax=Silene latifolia TaxID=37657 RepID=UPI003D76F8FA
METTFYLCNIFILVATYLSVIYIWGKLQNRPPSPFLCFPVIGHLYVAKHPLSESLANLKNRFGPIIFLWFGSRPSLIVSSPSAAEECLNTNDVVFCNRVRGTFVGKYRGYDYTSLNFAPYGPHWRNLRKICTVEVLSSKRLQSLAAIRADEVKLLIKRLCNSSSSQGVEMRPQIFDANLNMMTRMIFGESYFGLEACTEKAKRVREIVMESIVLSAMPFIGDDVPYLRWLNWRENRRFMEYKDKRDSLFKELMEEHRIKKKEMTKFINLDVKVKPMIHALLELQESNPEYYHDHLLHSLILDLLIGSSETSTNTVEWALSLLLNHPQVLEKVRIEIDNHVGFARLLEEPDLNHLPYLRCVLNETLRMYPPFPLLFPHESSPKNDCIVGGYRIPRGTLLLVNIYAIQNDPMIWDSPRTFRPERFEGIEGHKVGYKMMPFGSGRRSCPGEGLAIRVMGLMLGTIIHCLDFRRIDDTLVDMTQLDSPNMQMAMPLNARIEPRQFMLNLLEKN